MKKELFIGIAIGAGAVALSVGASASSLLSALVGREYSPFGPHTA